MGGTQLCTSSSKLRHRIIAQTLQLNAPDLRVGALTPRSSLHASGKLDQRAI
jgi:hypothetical protein